ncbi:MAG: hypothetical protein HY329_28325 [Chloroflexi bacterium]|nr:hypothetical protein [Chloroflexota bacterium]
MARFRKQPVEISAVQITAPMTIETPEGTMRGEPGDWLITGVKGEQYFCKPDIFRLTYEPVGLEAQVIWRRAYRTEA